MTYKADVFIEAIKGSGGIKTAICHRVGCTRATFDRYLQNYSTVNEAFEAEKRSMLDTAQSVIFNNIKLALQQQQAERVVVDSSDAKWLLSRLDPEYKDKIQQDLTGEIMTTKGYVLVSPEDWDE